MKILVETVFGTMLLGAMLFAVDCLPKQAQHPTLSRDAGTAPACPAPVAPAQLCNSTTKTSPPHECAICPDPARHCMTSTAIYCATSCDEPLCEQRK